MFRPKNESFELADKEKIHLFSYWVSNDVQYWIERRMEYKDIFKANCLLWEDRRTSLWKEEEKLEEKYTEKKTTKKTIFKHWNL